MSTSCDDQDMGRDPALDDRLAEQLLRGRCDDAAPAARALADVLADLRHTAHSSAPRPSAELQRIFAEGVPGATGTTVPAPPSPTRTRVTRGWRPARLTLGAAGFGLVIKLALGTAVAAAAASGIGLSDGSSQLQEVSDPIPGPDPMVEPDRPEALPPGGFAPTVEPDTSPPPPATGNAGAPGSGPWAPGRSLDLEVQADPSDRTGADVADEARDQASRGRELVESPPSIDRDGPPAGQEPGSSDGAPDPPPPAKPGPPDDPTGSVPGPDTEVTQPDASTDVAPPTVGATPPPGDQDGSRPGPGFETSGAPAAPPGPAGPAGPLSR